MTTFTMNENTHGIMLATRGYGVRGNRGFNKHFQSLVEAESAFRAQVADHVVDYAANGRYECVEKTDFPAGDNALREVTIFPILKSGKRGKRSVMFRLYEIPENSPHRRPSHRCI